jgi:hypothetical protein
VTLHDFNLIFIRLHSLALRGIAPYVAENPRMSTHIQIVALQKHARCYRQALLDLTLHDLAQVRRF